MNLPKFFTASCTECWW